MTWDEFKTWSTNSYNPRDAYVETTIKCPICGKNIYLDNAVILTSNPPQHRYVCDCGWCGYAYHGLTKIN